MGLLLINSMAFEKFTSYAAEHPGRTIAGMAAVGLGVAFVPHATAALGIPKILSVGTALKLGGTIGVAGPIAVGISQSMH